MSERVVDGNVQLLPKVEVIICLMKPSFSEFCNFKKELDPYDINLIVLGQALDLEPYGSIDLGHASVIVFWGVVPRAQGWAAEFCGICDQVNRNLNPKNLEISDSTVLLSCAAPLLPLGGCFALSFGSPP